MSQLLVKCPKCGKITETGISMDYKLASLGGTDPGSVSSANSRLSHISCAIAIAAAWVMIAKALMTWKKSMSL